MINIVLFGAPGCGKGTQAQRLKAHYGIEHVSTGEVIRDEIRRGTELGRSMESYIKAGKLAPDEIVIGMVANYVSEHKHVKGCIFDGFPRTTVQAEEFDKLLARHGLKVDIMVDIHVPEEELVQRILLRGKDSGRADDASEEVIRGRLDVYRQQTAVVSDYYAAQGKYASVNGTGSMEEVFSRITDVIDQLQYASAADRRSPGKSCSGLYFCPLSRPAAGVSDPHPAPARGMGCRNTPGLRRQARTGTFAARATAVRTPRTAPSGAPATEPARRYGDKTEKKVRGFAILQIIRIFATPLRGN